MGEQALFVLVSGSGGWRLDLDPCRAEILFVPKGQMAWIFPFWRRLALAGNSGSAFRSLWRRATNRIWKARRGLVSELSDLHPTDLFRKGRKEGRG